MRIKLTLRPRENRPAVPVNYQYPLSAAIYRILREASPEYSAFLHDRGYAAPSGRLLKLFTFSKLWIPGGRFSNGRLVGSPSAWTLQIGSPMLEQFVQNFVFGLFQMRELTIAGGGTQTSFVVETVETLTMPGLSERMRWRCLSPITASTMVERGDKLQRYFYRPHDLELPETLRRNLLQKHQTLHNAPPASDALAFNFESRDRPKGKLITIKEGKPDETRISCFESHFTLSGSTELMRTAWQCGLGEHGSQGFGMIAPIG